MLKTVFILSGQRLVAGSRETMESKPGRQAVTFLLMINIALFLINTFEHQKAAVNQFTIAFFGKGTWTVIVHSTIPLTIFHRFHSSVCLSEIWKNSYRVKISYNNSPTTFSPSQTQPELGRHPRKSVNHSGAQIVQINNATNAVIAKPVPND